MANTNACIRQRRSQLRGSTRGMPWMSERQFDAYLQARDTLRRLRAVASLTSDASRYTSPEASSA
jgi:hypothetical protein